MSLRRTTMRQMDVRCGELRMQIETFHKFLYDTEPNYSERFTYLLTPVDRNKGCNPEKVYDCIRKYGLVDNKDFPTPKDEEEFHDVSEISGSLLAKGQYWFRTIRVAA